MNCVGPESKLEFVEHLALISGLVFDSPYTAAGQVFSLSCGSMYRRGQEHASMIVMWLGGPDHFVRRESLPCRVQCAGTS